MKNGIKDLTIMLVSTIKNKMSTENPWVSYDDISNLLVDTFCDKDELQLLLYQLLTNGTVNAIYNESISHVGDLTDLLFCIESYRQEIANKYFNEIFEDGIAGLVELMNIYVDNEDYEKAAIYRDRIKELRNETFK